MGSNEQCPWTDQEKQRVDIIDTFGTTELLCFCHLYIRHYDSLDTGFPNISVPSGTDADNGASYDFAMKCCVLIMRGLLTATFTQRVVSFVESPLPAQQVSAIAARSSVYAAGIPFTSLEVTDQQNSFGSIESLFLVFASVYQVMINGTYLTPSDAFWSLKDATVYAKNVTFGQLFMVALPNTSGSQSAQATYSAAMPSVTFDWPTYLAQCAPPYCDIIKHNSVAYRFFWAISAFEGIWTTVFVVVRTLLWPVLNWAWL